MKRRGLIVSLAGIILVAALALGATIISGKKPLLGLDLRGGVSLVLQPQGHASKAALQQSVNIIDRRVNGLGVANSNVTQQGKDVVIELPGIKHSQTALKTLGQTAVLYFRPVYCEIPPLATSAASKGSSSSPSGSAKVGLGAPGRAALASAEFPLTSGSSPAATSGSKGPTAGTTPATTVVPNSASGSPVPLNAAPSRADCSASNAASLPNTPPLKDTAKATVILPQYDNTVRYVLGPADLKGDVVKNAVVVAPTNGGGYTVQVTFTPAGGRAFDKIAAQRYKFYSASSSVPNPASMEAIDLDGVVEAAPTIQAPSFHGTAVISGSTAAPFTAAQAKSLALELRYGSLPVRFIPQSVQTVSATIGKDSLKAGLLAGLGGIAVVLLYMMVYYRALGVVVVVGLGVGGALLYSILTELGQSAGYALTLAGVTGIIVSIGITVDSYVVYFERLKDEVRSGRTVRQSVERGFTRAFRTVLTADFVSFLAALILYLLTVGSVKGFAFTLGLSTLLDVFTAYFFIRPMVIIVGRTRSLTEARWFGVGRGLGAAPLGGTLS